MKLAVVRMKHRLCQRLLVSGALAVITVSASGQGIPVRFPVTSAQIIAAMQNRQLPTEGVEVKISAPMTTSIEKPLLEIQTITLLNTHTAQIKVACRNRSECFPFYISASWPEESASAAISQAVPGTAGSTHPTASQQLPSPKTSLPRPESSKNDQPQVVHAGTSAMLSMDQDRIHVLVRVICLEGGIAGDKVRVSTPDHKQAYVAEIVSPTLLKGSF